MAIGGESGRPRWTSWATGWGGSLRGDGELMGLAAPLEASFRGPQCSQKDSRSRGPKTPPTPSTLPTHWRRKDQEGQGAGQVPAEAAKGRLFLPGVIGPRPPRPLAGQGGGEAGQWEAWQKVDSGRKNRAKASLLSPFTAREGNKAVSPDTFGNLLEQPFGAALWGLG